MKQSVTIKDVAKEAGVSVATVSYVINNRTDKRISEKTRKKVLQIINLLGYTPNQSAKALATNRNQLLALYLSAGDSLLKNAEQSYFLHFLISYFHKKNYDFIPLVAYDCMIHDPLFFQINSNYRNILEQADIYFSKKPYTLVLLDTKNCEKKDFLSTLHADIRYVRDFLEVSAIKEENLVVVDHVLYQLLNSSHNTLYVPSIRTEKADALLTCLEYALQRIPIRQHDILI